MSPNKGAFRHLDFCKLISPLPIGVMRCVSYFFPILTHDRCMINVSLVDGYSNTNSRQSIKLVLFFQLIEFGGANKWITAQC